MFSYHLLRQLREKQRAIDVELLWPALKDLSEDLAFAKRAMLAHALGESNWTTDLTDQEIVALIDALQ